MNSISIVRSSALRLTLAGICTAAIVSAASARAETDTAYRTAVEHSIDREISLPGMAKGRQGVTTLAVTVRPDGTVRSIDIVRSSGFAAFDKAAIRTAQRVSYPAAPTTRTLAMVLGFNRQVQPAQQSEARALVAAWLTDTRTRLAADTSTAQQPDS